MIIDFVKALYDVIHFKNYGKPSKLRNLKKKDGSMLTKCIGTLPQQDFDGWTKATNVGKGHILMISEG